MTVTTTTIGSALSMFRNDWPGIAGATRNVTSRMRSAERVGGAARIRYIMAWRGMACALCGLSGSWLLPLGHPLRMTFGHIVGLSLYGSTNIANLTPQHDCCNTAAKRTPDLRGLVEYSVDSLPSQTEADEWKQSGGVEAHEPESLPTETACRMARKGRGLPF